MVCISRIRSEYKLIISPYLVQMRKNTDRKNSEYEHFLRSETFGTVLDILLYLHQEIMTITLKLQFSLI